MKRALSIICGCALFVTFAWYTPNVQAEAGTFDLSGCTNDINWITDMADMFPDTVQGLERDEAETWGPNTLLIYDGTSEEVQAIEVPVNEFAGVTQTEPFVPEEIGVGILEPITPNHVFPPDSRVQITNVNAYPYRAVAFLELTFAGGNIMTGSGIFVGDRLILTAGHNVYDHKYNFGKVISVKVIPGGTLSNYPPTQTSKTAVLPEWSNNYNEGCDFGFVLLDDSLGTGYFGVTSKANSELEGAAIWNYGYPGDKTIGTLWYCAGTISAVGRDMFLHDADTETGNSGGPVVLQSEPLYAVGVHTGLWPNTESNRAVRITDAIVSYVIFLNEQANNGEI